MNQGINRPISRPVAIWLMIGVGMLLVQVILGGITRLTGSGLSITEWNVVTHLLPPLSEQQWVSQFNEYRQTPQYNLLNTHFTLADFKFIFFWEWVHRSWAKLIAIAFLVPFIIFIWQKRITRPMVRPLVLLFLLGALQGVIGWIMVKSGLVGDAIYVAPTRLALHFVFALALIAYAFLISLKWLLPQSGISRPGLRKLTTLIVGLIFLQLVFGALMAGHKAATAAPTWPGINGSLIPSGLFSHRPILLNFIENKLTIHFIHRGLAYILFLLLIGWTIQAFRVSAAPAYLRNTRGIPLLLICLQVTLGVFSLLSSPDIKPNYWGTFEWLALMHQIAGMLLLLTMVWMLYFLFPKYQTQQL